MIDICHILILAIHLYPDALGCPYTHALGLELGKLNAAAIKAEIAVFFEYILLRAEKIPCSVYGDAPGFFLKHFLQLRFCVLMNI